MENINFENEFSYFKEFLIEQKIPGITQLKLEKLYLKFGSECIHLFFNNNFDKINTVLCYNIQKKESIVHAWQKVSIYCKLHIALRKHGLSYISIRKIYKKYNNQSLIYLYQNPYILIYESGYGFKSVDQIGLELGIKKDSEIRCSAAIIAVLLEKEKHGDTVIIKTELEKETLDLLKLFDYKLSQSIFNNALRSLEESGNISSLNLKYYGLKKYFDAEKDILFFIQNNLKCNIQKQISKDIIHKHSSILSNEQYSCIIQLLEKSIGILTGCAGTGKSTVISAIYNILNNYTKHIIVLTPTGKASQRITLQYPNINTMTIHKCLFQNKIFFHDNYQGPYPNLPYQYIIVDESSMIDSFLMATLLRCLNPTQTTIYFFGDEQQLPPVSAGSPFHTFIQQKLIPIYKLTQIFRQNSNSKIISLANTVANNQKAKLNRNDEIEWIDATKKNFINILHKMIDLYYNKEKRILSFVGVTFLNRGLSGTININIEISNYIHKKYGVENTKIINKFYLFDIVIVSKNLYKKNLRNGQMGRVIGGNEQSIQIFFSDIGTIILEKEYASILELGYVINVYKSQGSEFQTLVIFLFMEQYILLNHQALYTAITRTKKNIIFIGQKKAFYCASLKKENQRDQFLIHF